MLFLLCMTNHLQAGRNLSGWKNTTGKAQGPATPWYSRAAGPLLTPAATEMQSWGSEGSAPHSEPLGGSCCGCGVLPGWLGRELAWGQVPKAGGGWKRQALCGYHGTQAALSQQGQLLWGKQRGADGETPHRESLSHPFPMPPTAPETSKLPELIDYQGQISILLNYNLVLMHVFTLYLFHVGN